MSESASHTFEPVPADAAAPQSEADTPTPTIEHVTGEQPATNLPAAEIILDDVVGAARLTNSELEWDHSSELRVSINPKFDSDKLVERVYRAVKHTFTHKISPANIMEVVTEAMMAVEKINGASGVQKKEVVMSVLEKLVDEIPASDGAKNAIESAVQLIGPAAIDAIVSASNGKYNFGHIVKATSGCFSCFG